MPRHLATATLRDTQNRVDKLHARVSSICAEANANLVRQVPTTGVPGGPGPTLELYNQKRLQTKLFPSLYSRTSDY
eukprot:COSAG02_NODE_2133_length_9721_cov_11.017044_2_plen_76_part_00